MFEHVSPVLGTVEGHLSSFSMVLTGCSLTGTAGGITAELCLCVCGELVKEEEEDMDVRDHITCYENMVSVFFQF